MRILVTGGAGFIGSALVRRLVSLRQHDVLTVDCLTYAGSLAALAECDNSSRHKLERVDIRNFGQLKSVIQEFAPDIIFHLAAESHVDRSISGATTFVETNVVGTFNLLQASLEYWRGLPASEQNGFRLIHVSTDEVFGSLGDFGQFGPQSRYAPNSPYAATKASSDHLARSWWHTFGMPVIVTNCGNNYGPFQAPEKFIPVVITSALMRKKIPVYGSGRNIRDWIFVEDHVRALEMVSMRGQPGSTYLVSGRNEWRNLDIVNKICEYLDVLFPASNSHQALISFVTDRPGHDWRYSIADEETRTALGWAPITDFQSGLRTTIDWYVKNQDWCAAQYARAQTNLNG